MFKYMKAHTHLKPGQNGTLQLVQQFGDKLLCVRYRYDQLTGDTVKTAEILVYRKPSRNAPRYREADMVTVAVPYTRKDLQERLKSAGGRWDPTAKLWRVRFGSIRTEPALIERIVRERP